MVGAGVVCGWRVSPLSNLVEIKKAPRCNTLIASGRHRSRPKGWCQNGACALNSPTAWGSFEFPDLSRASEYAKDWLSQNDSYDIESHDAVQGDKHMHKSLIVVNDEAWYRT